MLLAPHYFILGLPLPVHLGHFFLLALAGLESGLLDLIVNLPVFSFHLLIPSLLDCRVVSSLSDLGLHLLQSHVGVVCLLRDLLLLLHQLHLGLPKTGDLRIHCRLDLLLNLLFLPLGPQVALEDIVSKVVQVIHALGE